MTALTQGTGYFVKRLGGDEATQLIITTLATAVSADTLTVDLSDYGINTFLGIDGMVHSTTDSIIVKEVGTTAVSAGVLTVTIGGSAATKKRTYIVYGE
jgi:hypothetical protein